MRNRFYLSKVGQVFRAKVFLLVWVLSSVVCADPTVIDPLDPNNASGDITAPIDGGDQNNIAVEGVDQSSNSGELGAPLTEGYTDVSFKEHGASGIVTERQIENVSFSTTALELKQLYINEFLSGNSSVSSPDDIEFSILGTSLPDGNILGGPSIPEIYIDVSFVNLAVEEVDYSFLGSVSLRHLEKNSIKSMDVLSDHISDVMDEGINSGEALNPASLAQALFSAPFSEREGAYLASALSLNNLGEFSTSYQGKQFMGNDSIDEMPSHSKLDASSNHQALGINRIFKKGSSPLIPWMKVSCSNGSVKENAETKNYFLLSDAYLGYDFKKSSDFLMGAAANYSIDRVRTANYSSKSLSHSIGLMTYASYRFYASNYLQLQVGYTDTKINNQRLASLMLRGDRHGQGYYALMGYRGVYQYKMFSLKPYLRMHGVFSRLGSYQENGTSEDRLLFKKINCRAALISSGFSLSHPFQWKSATFVSRLGLGYLRRFQKQDDQEYATILAPDSYEVIQGTKGVNEEMNAYLALISRWQERYGVDIKLGLDMGNKSYTRRSLDSTIYWYF